MTLPFATAATAQYDYAEHLTRINEALQGFEKATLFLGLIGHMERDKIVFGDMFRHAKNVPALQQAFVDKKVLAHMCQDTDGTCFCPNDDATAIHIADTIESSQEAWHRLIACVRTKDVDSLPAKSTPYCPSAPA